MCSPYGANLPKFFKLAATGFSRSLFCGLREKPLDLVSASVALLLHHAGCEKLICRMCCCRKLCSDRPGLAFIRSSYGKSSVSRLNHGDYLLNYLVTIHGFYGRSGSWSHFAPPGMDSIHCGCDRGLPDNSCFLFTSIEACMSFVPNHHIVLLPEVTANQNASPQLTESSLDRPAASSLASRQYRNREK